MSKFEAGDVVVLKSGSEKMTILSDNGDETYMCTWREKGETHTEDFHGVTLQKYESGISWGSNPKRNNHY